MAAFLVLWKKEKVDIKVGKVNYSTKEFEKKYTYNGADLGATWEKDATTFRVWAPMAEKVALNLYREGNPEINDLLEQLPMEKDKKGTWFLKKTGDLNGIYYTYSVWNEGVVSEATDPYAKTTGVNGVRSMVIDMSATNPKSWETDEDPNGKKNITDAIIYELHVRDLSIAENSGIQNKGKFLGVAESGTQNPSGHSTGLDYMKELGITHLHLLPATDYGMIDEMHLEVPQFNWGYGPVNYNVPEGSYSTDPFHGEVRVREMKQMVQTLHRNGISVVLDVVYNHVLDAEQFCFNKIVPGYFCRIDKKGRYSNGSGCGNDVATERSMVKKYIVDSVCYWAEEYHIDGFRFDLAGLIDTETINELVEKVHKKHPNVIFYGEGWTMPTGITKKGYLMATQLNSDKTPEVAYFSDTLRDSLKGSVFYAPSKGYVTGAEERTETIKACLLGQPGWCKNPSQTVNYASCHDNNTLMDKIALSTPEASFEERIRSNNLAAAIYMLAQGIPFIHAGEEILRTKVDAQGHFVENSYDSPDYVNCIDWSVLDNETYQKNLAYYKGLIQIRKRFTSLRYMTAEEVKQHVVIVEPQQNHVIVMHVRDVEKQEELLCIFNPGKTTEMVEIWDGPWEILVQDGVAGVDTLGTIENIHISVAPISAMVLVKSAN